MNEAQAFVQQARSDLAVFHLLLAQDRQAIPECHPLHYLQMATEKLAKAAMCAGRDRSGVPGGHVAFSKVVGVLKRRDVALRMGWDRFDAYRTFLHQAAPLIREIEELNPAVTPSGQGGYSFKHPNVEYPWPGRDQQGDSTWRVPAEYDFGLIERRLRQMGTGYQLLMFVERLTNRFESVFQIEHGGSSGNAG